MTAAAIVAAGVWVYMTTWFVVAIVERRDDVVDTAWGLGFAAIAAFFAARTEGSRTLLVAFIVAFWGIRLALHINRRNRRRGEDFRYVELRRRWRRFFVLRTYIQVFMLQGAFMVVISLPVIAVGASSPSELSVLDFLGITVAVAGVFIEATADAQLERFRRRRVRKTKFLQQGLWAWSRHPNYFGETLVWWGLWLVSLSTPYGPWAILGPLAITFLLTKVTGIPMLERKYEGDPEFESYKARVNAFVPMRPKRTEGPTEP